MEKQKSWRTFLIQIILEICRFFFWWVDDQVLRDVTNDSQMEWTLISDSYYKFRPPPNYFLLTQDARFLEQIEMIWIIKCHKKYVHILRKRLNFVQILHWNLRKVVTFSWNHYYIFKFLGVLYFFRAAEDSNDRAFKANRARESILPSFS